MKLNIIILLFLSNMVLMCKNDKPNKETKTQTKTETKFKKTTVKETGLKVKKSADYSSLFTTKNDICLTINEMAEATGLEVASISEGEKYSELHCYFNIKLPNGEIMKCHYHALDFGDDYSMIKELKSLEEDKEFKKKSLGMFTELSQTEDTYIVHNKLRNEIRIMNTSYPKIVIMASYKTAQDNLSDEQKNIRDQYTTKIANHLLQKHKK